MVVVQAQSQLFQVVLALCPAGRFAGLLDGGEQQRDQDGDDRDDHQQLNQCKANSTGGDFWDIGHSTRQERSYKKGGSLELAPRGRPQIL